MKKRIHLRANRNYKVEERLLQIKGYSEVRNTPKKQEREHHLHRSKLPTSVC